MGVCILSKTIFRKEPVFKEIKSIDTGSSGSTVTFSNLSSGKSYLMCAVGCSSGSGEITCYNGATVSVSSSSGVTFTTNTVNTGHSIFNFKVTSSTNSIVLQWVRSGRYVCGCAFLYEV